MTDSDQYQSTPLIDHRSDPRDRPPPSRGLFVVGVILWLVLVPIACLIAGGLITREDAQSAALETEAARSVAELSTSSAYLAGSAATAETTANLVDLPATWAAAGTAAAPSDTPTDAATTTPAASATPIASATQPATATADATQTEPTAPLTGTVIAADSSIVIGQSVAGRPLTVTQFGDGPVVRLIVAGIHGGSEWNTIALADELIAHLQANPALVPDDVTLYILRSLNPDGEARGRDIYARANENNVDLNRNWPSNWQADWVREGCWNELRLSGGAGAGSEPETQALMDFMLEREVEAVISYHSAALGIFPGGQPPDAASVELAVAVADVSDYPYPPLDFGCVYTGQLIDWAVEQGIAALDIELANHRDIELEQNIRILEVFLSWRR